VKAQLLLVAVVPLVAACAGGNSTAAYRKHALAICARYRAAGRAAERRFEKSIGSHSTSTSVAAATDPLTHALADLRKLKPADSQKKLVRRWLSAGQRLVQVTREQLTVLTRDQRRVEAELKHLKLPHHRPTAEELKHPTAAIFGDVYAHSPAWRQFVRDANRSFRPANRATKRFTRLARQLGLAGCLR
jgi:hypothetical protein